MNRLTAKGCCRKSENPSVIDNAVNKFNSKSILSKSVKTKTNNLIVLPLNHSLCFNFNVIFKSVKKFELPPLSFLFFILANEESIMILIIIVSYLI